MPTELTPIQLLVKIVHKDEEAFKQFYARLGGLVFGLGFRILRSRVEAEELVQDVFWQVWNQASLYDESKGKPEAWLVTIARSRAIDRLRAGKRRNDKLTPLDDAPQVEDTAADPGTQAQGREVRLNMENLLARIPEAQRQALELAYFEGYTQSEISAKLSLPLGTVKTRMRDGMKKLKELLKDERTVEKV